MWPWSWSFSSDDGPPGSAEGRLAVWLVSRGLILGSAAVAIESLYYKGDRLDFPGLRFLHLIAHYSRAWNIGLLAVLAGGVVEIISIGRRRGWSRSILLGAVLAAALGALVLFGLINGLAPWWLSYDQY